MAINFNNQKTNIIATGLLALMFFLAFFSLRGDSATMDELAHTPAGYSYISQKDMRLNPEHPPLLKSLAGASVWLGSKITGAPIYFPSQIKSWQTDVNGQWDFGRYFFYQAGNDADKIIFWGRLPMLLVMLILGFYVFCWARKLYGDKAGLLALFLYSLSPTFLAHSRYVTTDVGAAGAFFIATYYFLKWLKNQNNKNLIISGLVFGLALLTKFSLALLVPYFIFLIIIYIFINNPQEISFGLTVKKYFLKIILMGLIAFFLIWPVYQYHTWNYPPQKQQADTEFILKSFNNETFTNPIVWMSDKPILRPITQYILGLLMVGQRAVGGNTTYFLGEISNQSWKSYFPVAYAIKTPIALHLLTILALLFLAWQIKKPFGDNFWQRFLAWLKKYFIEFSMISFIALYWIITLKSNLNIGIRHILPTFPFIYILVSGQIIKLTEKCRCSPAVKDRAYNKIRFIAIIPLSIILAWYGYASLSAYPHYLAYFNELVGGSKNGYQYMADSNLDWGQDLKRLVQFMENPPTRWDKIDKIYLDYFGGGSPKYYLGDKYKPWWGERSPNELPPDSWLAISATMLQGGRGQLVHGFMAPSGYYNWLNQYEPEAIIGHSIFIYFIP